MNFFTGIGSRSTPPHIMEEISIVSKMLTEKGYVLRSGKAAGADAAFQLGAEAAEVNDLTMEIYIPWKGFRSDENLSNQFDIVPMFIHDLCPDIAMQFHPAWGYCSPAAKKLHSRNVCQVIGNDLKTPSCFVLYYAEEKNGKVKGGTAMAVSIARHYNVPTINMFFPDWSEKLDLALANIG